MTAKMGPFCLGLNMLSNIPVVAPFVWCIAFIATRKSLNVIKISNTILIL